MSGLDPNNYFDNQSYNIDWSDQSDNNQSDNYTWIPLTWIPTACATCGDLCTYFGDCNNPEPQIVHCNKCAQHYYFFENIKW